ncbi:MAG: 3-keto-5-aminohexanoate cleavage protein [Deltaproteobacteria bacterium]|nr:MAG: 3-keto-5-aminohexanoate cleavage protein [Deltaproteobacteria bacterium]
MNAPLTPLMITAAINGAEVTRHDNPTLPITPEEVGEEARRCAEEGACIVHLHGRNPDGTPSQDVDVFRDYFEAIRDRTDIIVQFSTGGAVGMDLEERIAALALRPEMATLTTGSVNFGDGVFVNRVPEIREIASRLTQFEVRAEIEVFDLGMLDTAFRLVDEGALRGPQHVNLVLGVPGAMSARTSHVDYLVSLLPAGWTWSVAGIGRHELAMARHAIEQGGHVRVGLEDNIFLRRGELADGSHSLVREVARMASEAGRPLMVVHDARILLRVQETRFPAG